MLNADEGRLFPPLEYMQLSDPVRFFEDPTGRVAPGGPKLIVLDLNGALLFRSATRKAHPRPYLRAFLQYIFHPGHQSASGESERPYEVFVWSSAQPHNVQYMVDYAFGPYAEGLYDPQTGEPLDADIAERSGKLLGVWARDKLLNASTSDYRRKVQTYKDLRTLLAHIDPSGQKYNLLNTILIDDSVIKAKFQPWNHINITEYEAERHSTSLKLAADPANALETPYVLEKQKMDSFLLAVVGMLDEIRNVGNVPVFLRSENLAMLPRQEDSRWRGRLSSEAPNMRDDGSIVLPTDEREYLPWYLENAVFKYWLGAGVKALSRMAIPIDHGLPRPEGVSQFNMTGRKVSLQSPQFGSAPQRQGVWGNPSRQYSTSPPNRTQVQGRSVGASDDWRARSPGSLQFGTHGQGSIDGLVNDSAYYSSYPGQNANHGYQRQAGSPMLDYGTPHWQAGPSSFGYGANRHMYGDHVQNGVWPNAHETLRHDDRNWKCNTSQVGAPVQPTQGPSLRWETSNDDEFIEDIYEEFGAFAVLFGQYINTSDSARLDDVARRARKQQVVDAVRYRFDRFSQSGFSELFPLHRDPMYLWLEAKRQYEPSNATVDLALRRWQLAFDMVQQPLTPFSAQYWREAHARAMRHRELLGMPTISLEQWRLSMLEMDFRAKVLPEIEMSDRRHLEVPQIFAPRPTRSSGLVVEQPFQINPDPTVDPVPEPVLQHSREQVITRPHAHEPALVQPVLHAIASAPHPASAKTIVDTDFLAYNSNVYLGSVITTLGPFYQVGGVAIQSGSDVSFVVRNSNAIARRGRSLLAGLAKLAPSSDADYHRLGSALAFLWDELQCPWPAQAFGQILGRWELARRLVVHQTQEGQTGAGKRKGEKKVLTDWKEKYEADVAELALGQQPTFLEWRVSLVDHSLEAALRVRAEQSWKDPPLGDEPKIFPSDPTAVEPGQYERARSDGGIEPHVTVVQYEAILRLIGSHQNPGDGRIFHDLSVDPLYTTVGRASDRLLDEARGGAIGEAAPTLTVGSNDPLWNSAGLSSASTQPAETATSSHNPQSSEEKPTVKTAPHLMKLGKKKAKTAAAKAARAMQQTPRKAGKDAKKKKGKK